MPKAEGLTLAFDDESKIDSAFLETIDYKGETQDIVYETREFSVVCPFSGLPDYGRLIIAYTPNRLIVELKSLKYYILTYRNVGIYQEAATNQFFQDLQKLLKPKKLKIQTIYNTRGGIDTTCTIEK